LQRSLAPPEEVDGTEPEAEYTSLMAGAVAEAARAKWDDGEGVVGETSDDAPTQQAERAKGVAQVEEGLAVIDLGDGEIATQRSLPGPAGSGPMYSTPKKAVSRNSVCAWVCRRGALS
jgi:hypothetical protein